MVAGGTVVDGSLCLHETKRGSLNRYLYRTALEATGSKTIYPLQLQVPVLVTLLASSLHKYNEW